MRFPMSSDDQHLLYPQFYGCGSSLGCGGCSAPWMPTTATSCPQSSAPSSTFGGGMGAAFIPLVLGPRLAAHSQPRHSSEPRHPHQRAGPSLHHMPSFHCLRDHVPQSVISDAFDIAQGLLGEIFGQPSCETSGTARTDQTTSDQPSSRRCSFQGKCCKDSSAQGRCNKESTAQKKCSKGSCASASQTTQTRSDNKKKTESRTSPKVNERASAEDKPATEPSTSSSPSSTIASDPQWTQTLSLPGFAPSKVSVKVKNGNVYVHAVHEKAWGPSSCLSKLQMSQTVTLPDTIDQQSLTCSMKPDGTLLFRAHFKKDLAVKNHDEEAEVVDSREENKEAPCMGSSLEKIKVAVEKEEKADIVEKEVEKIVALENKAEQVNAMENNSEDTLDLENRVEEMQALENRAEEVQALENRAEEMHALENKAEEVQALENTAEEVQALENKAEEVQALENTAEEVQALENRAEEVQALENKAEKLQDLENKAEREMTDEDVPEVGEEKQGEQSGGETQGDVKDDADQKASVEMNNTDISCPIIQEPEDESFSEDDEVQKKHSITHQSSTEDFVVLEDFTNAETMNFGDGSEDFSRDMEPMASEQVQQENEAGEEQTGEGINTHYKTDPTRPIKRTDNQETTSHDGVFRASMPLVGFNPQDVHVNLQGHILNIVAKRQAWLGGASYTENVERQVELPGYLDAFSVRCVYERDNGCLVISADPKGEQRQVPVVFNLD